MGDSSAKILIHDSQDRSDNHPNHPLYYIFGLGIVLLVFYLISLRNYLLFHTVAELFSIVVAFALFLIAWHSRRFYDNNTILFLGIAYLFVSILDLLHTLAYKGMPIFAPRASDLATQLWIVARYMESLSILLAILLINRRMQLSRLLGVYATITALLIGILFIWDIFPACFIEGSGLTAFKIASEYIICSILLLSAVLLIRKRAVFDSRVVSLLVGAIVLSILAELSFTLYTSVYGITNLIGHFFKFLSFFAIYLAVIDTSLRRPYELMFRDLKQSRENLREAHDHLSATVSALPDILFEVDGSGRIHRFWAPDVSSLYLQPQEFIGKKINEVMPEPAKGVILEAIREATKKGKHLGAVYCLEMGGRQRWYELGIALKGKDRSSGARLVALVRDITERKISEERISAFTKELEQVNREMDRRRKKAEKASSFKSRMLSMASYELRTPLHNILGYTAILDSDPGITPEGKESLARVRKSTKTLAILIENLLNMAQIEASKMELSPEPVELKDLFEDALDAVRALGKLKGLRLIQEIHGLAGPVLLDRDKLLLVLVNLVSNAVKFTDRGKIRLTAVRENSTLRIAIQDTGIGMTEGEISRLFSRFRRNDLAKSAFETGTGLGLNISYALVKVMDGTLEIVSEKNHGTKVYILLPLTETYVI